MTPLASSAKVMLIPDQGACTASENPVVVRRFRLARLSWSGGVAEGETSERG